MTTDPTDLIREVDAEHVPMWDNCMNACCSGEECHLRAEVCRECSEPWPCMTHRLRDALEASEAAGEINRGLSVDKHIRLDAALIALDGARITIKDLRTLRDEQRDRILRISRDHDTLVYALEQILHIEHGDMDEVATVGRIIAAGIKGFHDAYPIASRDTSEAPSQSTDRDDASEHPDEVEHLRAIIERVRTLRRTAVRDGHASPYLAHMIDQALEGLPDPDLDQKSTSDTTSPEENPHG